MLNDPKAPNAPTTLPEEAYYALKTDDFEPVAVIVLGEGGKEKPFIRAGLEYTLPNMIEAKNIERPHITVQHTEDVSRNFRCCYICTPWGCFCVPC